MADLNRVFLMGNLTADPEVRYAPSGDAVGDLRMAINRRYKGRDGQDHDEVCYVSVVVWGRQAETCGQYLQKGSQVMVEGSLKFDQWEKDGQKHSRLLVRANRVQFLGGRPQGQDGGSGQGGQGSYQPAPAAPAAPAAAPAPATPAPEPPPPPPPPAAGADKSGDDENLPF
ncbi:MAG: single-stranded DNA-binding protein [Kiritimatiellia bacterium]|jgi:single-strand DNA-binding protein|nr:single-stranded DNA-binding protein [Kiritimatiellia bacterium]MDP6629715.1 single-stranded DNA-binding protein [Kiritimatiellia bacterium]MDP6810954.1 single-stranded DNA-binding protein [Kiritimatiellia bacterium]MDP7023259.1 single-stranded DNA-binding protein [Kiritimatiellia bacterium]